MEQLVTGYYSAVVQELNGRRCTTLLHGTAHTATVATSCLVQPIVGDKVLLWQDSEECFIIQILKRESNHVTTEISCHGPLSIKSDAQLNLSAADEIGLQSQQIHLCSHREQHVANHFLFTGREAKVFLSRIDLSAERVVCRIKSLMQSLVDSVRTVKRLESVTASKLIQRASELFSVDSRRVLIGAKKEVRIDGEKIHMG
ncbi:MAG: DUF3540 domain-containing protein [Gammaproteobacteria bacterium]|nr:DUF3540 domain-containing protein [Gammaproteobacteria bacterium]